MYELSREDVSNGLSADIQRQTIMELEILEAKQAEDSLRNGITITEMLKINEIDLYQYIKLA